MRTMRAKMQVRSVTQVEGAEILEFSAVAASSYPADGSDENNTYAKFSPVADLKIHVRNEKLFRAFKPGQEFYVDFTPAQ